MIVTLYSTTGELLLQIPGTMSNEQYKEKIKASEEKYNRVTSINKRRPKNGSNIIMGSLYRVGNVRDSITSI